MQPSNFVLPAVFRGSSGHLKIFKASRELNLDKKRSFVWHFEVPRAKAPKERLAEPWKFLLDFSKAGFPPPPTCVAISGIYGSHSQAGKAPGSTKPKDDDEIEVAMAIGRVFHWKWTWVEI